MLVLGRLHVRKGIDSKFLELMGPTFCHAIRKGYIFFLKNLVAYLFVFCRPMLMSDGGWSIDIENAWLALFKVLGKIKQQWIDPKS